MSEETTLTGTFEDIADAIREKGISGTMKATEMPGKIRQIVQIDPEDYYTRSETSSAAELSAAFETISAEIDPALRTDIDSKVLVNEVSAQSLKINIMALSDYAAISGTAAFDPTAFYAISDDNAGGGGGGGGVDPSVLSGYYRKDETSSAVELENAFADRATLAQLSSKVLVNELSADLKIQVISKADYDVLSSGGTVDPEVFYCLSDWQPGGDMSDYYTKSQTSSAAEIDAMIGNINDIIATLN